MESMGVGVKLQTGRKISVGDRRSVAWPDLMMEGGRRRNEVDDEMVDGGVRKRTW